MSIALLQQKIHDRKVVEDRVERVELGEGITVDREGLLLFVTSGEGERALAGYVDNVHKVWRLYREWFLVLKETFGNLPSNMVLDGGQDD